ncbi:MAG: hypothetical protein FWD84_00235 [Oscillospiraceae bacterium]|nr:hypothetical protein [Oscillospiraceae bacterium]
MNFELKPIKNLMRISLILHIAGLCIAAIFLVFLQRPLWPFFTGNLFPEESTLFFPSLRVTVPIVVIFILHGCVAIGFFRMIRCINNKLEQLRTLSILSLIAVSTVFPIISFAWRYLEHFLVDHSAMTFDEVLAVNALQNLMAFGFVIRGIAAAVLLMAASMSWYYCFTKKTKNKETGCYTV